MEGNGSNEESDASSNLDHALLESLFYNEMLLMEDSAAEPALAPDLSLLTSPAVANDPAGSALEPPAMYDRMMSHHTGNVSGDPVMNDGDRNDAPGAHALPAQPAACDLPAHQMIAPSVPPATASVPGEIATEVSQVSQERAKQLVSQFATLASRLGISLPPAVLSSLTVAAAVNEDQTMGTGESLSGSLPPVAPDLTSSNVPVRAAFSREPPQVQQLESTAQAAIAAVTETRKRRETHDPPSASNGSRPLHSKRRKKPRLSDCEAKLAALRNENEMLKRHLATVTNKAHVFDQERQQATLEMKRMLEEEAPPEKLNPLLHKFSEMYSDYGRHRHQELEFHLGQLEKLVAPTTFTKMGLWTLGQNEGFYTNPKRNPIAGILRKELDITPMQGRKILEQRQQIRDVCDNLKQCLVLLGKLKGICEYKQKIFHDRMSKCQEILTPIQVVKLLLWVDEHSHLLESVCPGWESERIRAKGESKPKST